MSITAKITVELVKIDREICNEFLWNKLKNCGCFLATLM